METQRVVSFEEAESFANNNNMQYYEVSAKTKQPKSLEDVLTIALGKMKEPNQEEENVIEDSIKYYFKKIRFKVLFLYYV